MINMPMFILREKRHSFARMLFSELPKIQPAKLLESDEIENCYQNCERTQPPHDALHVASVNTETKPTSKRGQLRSKRPKGDGSSKPDEEAIATEGNR